MLQPPGVPHPIHTFHEDIGKIHISPAGAIRGHVAGYLSGSERGSWDHQSPACLLASDVGALDALHGAPAF